MYPNWDDRHNYNHEQSCSPAPPHILNQPEKYRC